MTETPEDSAARYLDGDLSVRETEQFEQALFRSDVSRDFREELLLRELLGTLPPVEPPTELVSDIEAIVMVQLDTDKTKTRRFANVRAALSGMGWMVKGPQMAMSS